MTTPQMDAVDDAENEPTGRRRITLELPVDLLDSLDRAARDRIVGRALLIEFLLRDGLDALVPVDELRGLQRATTEVAAGRRDADDPLAAARPKPGPITGGFRP